MQVRIEEKQKEKGSWDTTQIRKNEAKEKKKVGMKRRPAFG